MRTIPHILAALALLLLAPLAPAQDRNSPLEAATAPASDKPLTVAPDPADSEMVRLIELLSGTFVSTGAPDAPALILHAAPVSIASVPNTLLIEVARADSPADPFRVYFLHAFRRQGELRLRALEPAGGANARSLLAGLWAAPDALPKHDLVNLSPTTDLIVRGTGTEFRATTPHPFPTNRDGAIEMTSSLTITADALCIADAGFDAQGARVWGPPESAPIVLKRSTSTPTVQREDDLIIITTLAAPPEAPKLQPGGEVVIHYTSWLPSGRVVESSRDPNHEPVKARVPGAILPGLNKGLAGIAKGERRKIIIPPELAYGNDGRAPIPPKSTLIFEVECLKIDNAPSPQAPTTIVNPHAAPPGATPPVPADPNAPIGSPPTNGAPETPRGGH